MSTTVEDVTDMEKNEKKAPTWEEEEAAEEARLEAVEKERQEQQAKLRAQHEQEMRTKLENGEWKWSSIEQAFEQVEELNRVVDDEKTPYKSKYQARVILNTLLTENSNKLQQLEAKGIVEKMMNASSGNTSDETKSAVNQEEVKELTETVGRIELTLGMNHAETEEISTGEKLLSKAVEKLKNSQIKYALELITGWNQLGVIWCNRAKHRRAYTHLRNAQMCYQTYKKQREALLTSPSSTPDPLFSDTRWAAIEQLHTMTLFYLAQVYNHLKKRDLSATYCHLTLNRQLKHGTYDKQDWCTNAIGLGYYYTGQKQFQQAHHCLTAAQSMIDPKLIPVQKYADDVELTKEHEIAANLARAWGSFYLKRLLISRDHLIDKLLSEAGTNNVNVQEIKQRLDAEKAEAAQRERERDKNDPMDHGDTEEDKKQDPSSTPLNIVVTFKTLNLPESPECKPAENFEEARELFKEGLKWYTQATNYYQLDGWVSDHIPIQQEISHLYKLLAQFETDEARQTKMHKRRVDALEPIIEQLSRAAYLEFYQQLTHEVAQIYNDMMDIKSKVNAERPPGPERSKAQIKINELAMKSIKYYEIWIKTFDKDNAPPKEMDSYYQKSYFTALFVVARLYSKIYSEDANVYVTLLQKSLHAYQRCVSLVHQYHAEALFGSELSICEEMIHLLPLKMDKIRLTQRSFQE